jgi:hypothetical protein
MPSHQEQVQALDPAFGRMATEVGLHAWSLPQLTMRETTFVFLAADLCTASLGFSLATHVQMAGQMASACPNASRRSGTSPRMWGIRRQRSHCSSCAPTVRRERVGR